MGWAHHWVNGLMGWVPTWANRWVNGLMGWVGASYGSVSKQTRVSKPDSKIENRRAKLQKCRGGGMTTYTYIYIYIYISRLEYIYIYVHTYIYIYIYIYKVKQMQSLRHNTS